MKVGKFDSEQVIQWLEERRKVELVYVKHLITREMQLMMRVDESEEYKVEDVDGFDMIPISIVEGKKNEFSEEKGVGGEGFEGWEESCCF